MRLSRRRVLNAFLAAPIIIRTPGLLMPIKRIHPARLVPGVQILTIAELERKNREFWGLSPVTLYTNPVQTGRCIPNGTVWTNTEGTLRRGLSPLSPEQQEISAVYYRERAKRLRAFVESVHDMNGNPLPEYWQRETPFCADKAEAARRYEMARDRWNAAVA